MANISARRLVEQIARLKYLDRVSLGIKKGGGNIGVFFESSITINSQNVGIVRIKIILHLGWPIMFMWNFGTYLGDFSVKTDILKFQKHGELVKVVSRYK